MTGAIIGDIVGSRFEFDNFKSKDFELFHTECDFTDDSVMTLAIAKCLTHYDTITDYEEFKKNLVKVMHEVGRKYPSCGYGGRFWVWMMRNHTEPYYSYGNGSAMRVSPVAWFASSLEECEKLAQATAEITHDHPEGIKGAVAVAGAIYLARTGHTIDDIKKYTSRFYEINFTLDEIRDDYDFYEICQKSVPQALEAFFESTSFEDAIRNAISIGGDSDTIAAMTGSIAEAFYGIKEDIKDTAFSYLDEYLLSIAEEFSEKFPGNIKKQKSHYRDFANYSDCFQTFVVIYCDCRNSKGGIDMSDKKGHSSPGLFGDINHYDSSGKKIGESRPGLFGGYTNYDANGKKVGHSDPGLFGGYTHYDNKGHKTGRSDPGMFGSYNHYDANGKSTGSSDPGMFGGYNHSDTQGCYVATCVYGSYDCPEVWTLRRFRDSTLSENIFGRAFIKCYYAISPKIVKRFGSNKFFRKFLLSRLNKLVLKLQNKGYESSPYEDKKH